MFSYFKYHLHRWTQDTPDFLTARDQVADHEAEKSAEVARVHLRDIAKLKASFKTSLSSKEVIKANKKMQQLRSKAVVAFDEHQSWLALVSMSYE